MSRRKHSNSISQAHAVIDGQRRWCHLRGESLALLRELPDDCVDAIITDPPYSSGGLTTGERHAPPSRKYVRGDAKTTLPDFTGDNRDQRSFLLWSTLWLEQARRVAKPGAPICVFTDWRQLPVTTDAVQCGGWTWRGIVPWDKKNGRPAAGRFRNQCEYVVWGSNGPMPADRGVGYLAGVVQAAVVPKKKRHIAGKPIPLMRALVQICAPGGVILDPFSGSASTGVASLESGYRYIGIEMTRVYSAVPIARLTDVATCHHGYKSARLNCSSDSTM